MHCSIPFLYIFVTPLKLNALVTLNKMSVKPFFSASVSRHGVKEIFSCNYGGVGVRNPIIPDEVKDGVDMSPDQRRQNRADTLKYADLNTEAIIYNKTDG